MRIKISGYLFFYSILVFLVFGFFNIYIFNSQQRSNAAISLVEIIKSGNFSVANFKSYHTHYQVAAGFVDWPPLQLFCMTLLMFIFPYKISMILVSLIVTLLALYFLNKILCKYVDERTALAWTILASVWPFFFYEAGAPMLENGVLFFTLAIFYYFDRWLENNGWKDILIVAILFGVGFWWKTQIVFVLPALLIVYLYNSIKNKRFEVVKILFSVLLCALIIFPLVFGQLYLQSKGLSKAEERSVGYLNFFIPKGNYSGYLFWNDMENSFNFKGEPISSEKVNLILHRYDISVVQRIVLFLSLSIIPLIVFLMVLVFKRGSDNMQKLLIWFVISNVFIFIFLGGLPRYQIPLILCIIGFVGSKLRVSLAWFILLFVSLLFSAILFSGVYLGYHSQIQMNDYKSTVSFLLNNTSGEFTVLSTNIHPMAYELLKQDKERRAYIYLLPDNEASFQNFLIGEYEKPYPEFVLPKTKYIVVHEGRKSGLLPGLRDFNITGDFFVIKGKFPNSDTYIYEVD